MKNYFWQFIRFLKPTRFNLVMVAGCAGVLVPILAPQFQWFLIGMWFTFSALFALTFLRTP